MTVRVLHGDCLSLLPTLAPDSVDSVVTDPPYHLTSEVPHVGRNGFNRTREGIGQAARSGFMGKTWDGGDIAFRPETWAAILRVLKPGGFMVCFASTRGYHRMVCAIEDAGFVIHPMLGWIFGSGFPKATRFDQPELDGWRYGLQALKPALEPICMAQKPMGRGLTGSQNWAKHGVGGINVDACRVEGDLEQRTRFNNARDEGSSYVVQHDTKAIEANTLGRWPANVLHDGSPEVMAAFAAFGERENGYRPKQSNATWDTANGVLKGGIGKTQGAKPYNDTGSAARFFYCAKATKLDRAGSAHPTIKPIALMSWLVKLITPPGGTVLDPFAGSGTTLVAADRLQCHAIGIEQDAAYHADIVNRMGTDAPLFAAE